MSGYRAICKKCGYVYDRSCTQFECPRCRRGRGGPLGPFPPFGPFEF